jgi:uncharacterized protein (UPF0548 family)
MRLARLRQLERLRTEYERKQLTYEEVGATRGQLPAGYAHTRRRVRVGSGNDVFTSASDALLSWQMHRRSGLSVAADGPATIDRTVVLGLGYRLVVIIACRIVYICDEPRRRGFAYGTLPDHPEQGEESFIVSQDDDGTVWFDITVFSRPGSALIRYVHPIAKIVQAVWTRRYGRALLASVRDHP